MLGTVALLVLLRAESEIRVFSVGGIERRALIVLPKEPKGAPVIFAFHGHGGGMRQARLSFGIDRQWPEAIVVYPQGLPTPGMTDPEGKLPGWQQNEGEQGDRDLKFFDAMLSRLLSEFRIDKNRVYAMGHSNGGRMTYLLWAKRGERLAAVAPSASPGWLLVRQSRPLSAFIVAGRSDKLVSFASQERTIEAARTLLKTKSETFRETGFLRIEKGEDGLELATYITPGGHSYPAQASTEIAAFFKRHNRSDPRNTAWHLRAIVPDLVIGLSQTRQRA